MPGQTAQRSSVHETGGTPAFRYLGVLVVAIVAWLAILFTGRYPGGLFDCIEGVIRWHNRVVGDTDEYPLLRFRS